MRSRGLQYCGEILTVRRALAGHDNRSERDHETGELGCRQSHEDLRVSIRPKPGRHGDQECSTTTGKEADKERDRDRMTPDEKAHSRERSQARSGARRIARQWRYPIDLKIQAQMAVAIGDPVALAEALPEPLGHVMQAVRGERSVWIDDEQFHGQKFFVARAETQLVIDCTGVRAPDQEIGEHHAVETGQPVSDEPRVFRPAQLLEFDAQKIAPVPEMLASPFELETEPDVLGSVTQRGRVFDGVAVRDVSHLEQRALGPQGRFVERNIPQQEGNLPLPSERRNLGEIECPASRVRPYSAALGILGQVDWLCGGNMLARSLPCLARLNRREAFDIGILDVGDRAFQRAGKRWLVRQRRGSLKTFPEGFVKLPQHHLVAGEIGWLIEVQLGQPAGIQSDPFLFQLILDLSDGDAVQEEPDEALHTRRAVDQTVADIRGRDCLRAFRGTRDTVRAAHPGNAPGNLHR